jgi:hypothetical protein
MDNTTQTATKSKQMVTKPKVILSFNDMGYPVGMLFACSTKIYELEQANKDRNMGLWVMLVIIVETENK